MVYMLLQVPMVETLLQRTGKLWEHMSVAIHNAQNCSRQWYRIHWIKSTFENWVSSYLAMGQEHINPHSNSKGRIIHVPQFSYLTWGGGSKPSFLRIKYDSDNIHLTKTLSCHPWPVK